MTCHHSPPQECLQRGGHGGVGVSGGGGGFDGGSGGGGTVMVLITLSKGNNTIKTVAKCKREMAPKEEVLNPEA
jgi:hypothetical protein